MRKTANSDKMWEEAKKYIPGGVNSPVRSFNSVGINPPFIKRGEGAYIFDEDGDRYIDYVCSWGPCVLGHANPLVINAVKKSCDDGLTFGAPTLKETVLAKIVCDNIPSIEKIRFVSSGTEAVMSAVRTARGFTGKDKIIKFKGHYHGHSDGLLVKSGSGLMTGSVPDSSGVPLSYAKNTLIANWNDEASVERLFKENDDIAALIAEPAAANMGVIPPKKGFLEFLRYITEKHSAVLIFDEVITGFRLSFGGASEHYGVKPDMATYGKIIGGGLPLAAYGGKNEIMECVSPLGSVYQAGTLSGNPIAVTAGIETLKILRDNPSIYDSLNKKAEKLADAYLEKGIAVNRAGSLLSPFFTKNKVVDYDSALTSDEKEFNSYFIKMLNNGIYCAPSRFEAMFVSNAHTDDIIDETISVIKNVL